MVVFDPSIGVSLDDPVGGLPIFFFGGIVVPADRQLLFYFHGNRSRLPSAVDPQRFRLPEMARVHAGNLGCL